MTSQERVARVLAHKDADRIPRTDSFWPEIIPQWKREGMPGNAHIHEIFDFDIVGAGWMDMRALPGLSEVVEETEQWVTRKDGNGTVLRYWKGRSGTPEHIAFTTDTREKWNQLKAQLLAVPLDKRVNVEAAADGMKRARERDRWFCWAGVECFEIAKDVLGHELLCLAMAEDPEWAKDILDTETEVVLRVLALLESRGIRFDGAWIYGDIAFNTAPFCSPAMYREMVLPAHKRHVGWFKDRGVPVIYHTDGNFHPLIEPMLETGIDCFQPLEAKAGMDVRELKPHYRDRASWMGNIDAMVLLTNDPAQIEAEVKSKIPVAMKNGGYIYHSDHSIPPGVTWETYKLLMGLVEKHGRYV